jgi:hypothetical protein
MPSIKKVAKKKIRAGFKDFKPGKEIKGGLNPQPLPPGIQPPGHRPT